MSDFVQAVNSFLAPSAARDESFYEAIFRESIDGILVAGDGGTCMDANLAAVRMLGRSREGLIGYPLINLGDRVAGLEQFWRAERASAEEDSAASPQPDPRKPVEVAGVVEVRPGRHMIVIRDRGDERRSWDEQAALRRFAGKVAHDLGNQLMIISSYTEMMLDHMGTHDPMRKQASEVIKASSRAIELTHQLLGMHRKERIV